MKTILRLIKKSVMVTAQSLTVGSVALTIMILFERMRGKTFENETGFLFVIAIAFVLATALYKAAPLLGEKDK